MLLFLFYFILFYFEFSDLFHLPYLSSSPSWFLLLHFGFVILLYVTSDIEAIRPRAGRQSDSQKKKRHLLSLSLYIRWLRCQCCLLLLRGSQLTGKRDIYTTFGTFSITCGIDCTRWRQSFDPDTQGDAPCHHVCICWTVSDASLSDETMRMPIVNRPLMLNVNAWFQHFISDFDFFYFV